MPNSYKSIKRLDRSDAILAIKDMIPKGVEACGELVLIDDPRAYPPPVLEHELLNDAEIQHLRDSVRSLAEDYGFPRRPSAKSSKFSDFDRALGNILFCQLSITPTEAGHEEIWNYLTLRVLPDIARWRYQNEGKKKDYERWLGTARNVLAKTWWRRYTLGQELNALIGEDEAVAIMERTTIGMNPNLARAIVRVHKDISDQLNTSSGDLLRIAIKSIRRLSSIYYLDVLTEDDAYDLFTRTYWEAIKPLFDDE